MDRKRLIVGGVVVALLALGGGAAFAAQQVLDEEETPIAGGSVPAHEDNEAAQDGQDEAAEAREAESLRDLAGIDRGTAEEAALEAVPGKVKEVELENEGGSVVYEVEIAGEDGRLREVIVDAGHGKVLGQEIEQGEGSEDDAY